jgi:hypothetical protein
MSMTLTTLLDRFFKWMGASIVSRIGVGSFSQKKSSTSGRAATRWVTTCTRVAISDHKTWNLLQVCNSNNIFKLELSVNSETEKFILWFTHCNARKIIPLKVKQTVFGMVLSLPGCISNTAEDGDGILWSEERQTRHKLDYEQAGRAETPCPCWSRALAGAPKPAIRRWI